jgi:hypothetical protein
MVIKPTLRQNGQKMFSVYQELHVTVDNVLDALCEMLETAEWEGSLGLEEYAIAMKYIQDKEISRTKIMRKTLDNMLYNGNQWFLEGEAVDKYRDSAKHIMNELFPDFF